ncbi:MAG: hypothetical protein K6F08_00150 [bacterium]|nr:hypothetical protein [bacterium]
MFRFFSRHAWIFAVIFLLILFPVSLTSQARLNNRALITGLAIDKNESGYVVTAQIARPLSSREASGESAVLDFVSESGSSVTECVKKITFEIGEIAGLSHTNFIILSKAVLEDNAIKALDYFLRDLQIPTSVMIVYSKGNAKDVMAKTSDLDLSVSLGLQKVFMFKEEALSTLMVPLQNFIDDAFNPSAFSILPELDITTEETSSSGQSDDKSKSVGKGRIKYFTPFAIFKNGKFLGEINNENEIRAFLLAKAKNSHQFNLVIDGVNDDVYNNASVGVRVSDKNVKMAVSLGEKPTLNLNIMLDKVKLLEVNNNAILSGAYIAQKPYLTKTLERAIACQLENDLKIVFNKTKVIGADVFGFADFAYKFNHKEWGEFINSIPNADDYLNYVDFNVKVEVSSFI